EKSFQDRGYEAGIASGGRALPMLPNPESDAAALARVDVDAMLPEYKARKAASPAAVDVPIDPPAEDSRFRTGGPADDPVPARRPRIHDSQPKARRRTRYRIPSRPPLQWRQHRPPSRASLAGTMTMTTSLRYRRPTRGPIPAASAASGTDRRRLPARVTPAPSTRGS